MQPGIYRGIDNAAYHGGPGDSKSTLDIVRKSPAALRALRTGVTERRSTAAQALGTAFHALVLEPASFADEYALPFIAPAGALATVDDMKVALVAAGIEFKSSAKKDALTDLVREYIPDAVILSDAVAAHAAENSGRTIIDAETWAQLHRMRDAVMAHPAASKLLSAPGESELSCYWSEPVIDPSTGEQLRNEDGAPAEMLLRCRPDFWRHDGIIVDLKTTQPDHAAPEEFGRSVFNWRYYVQHPFYLNGTAKALQDSEPEFRAKFSAPRAFVFIAVENDACVVDGVAKGVGVYRLDEDAVKLGELHAAKDIATLWRCYQSGKWPGYSGRIEPLSLPGYAFQRAAASA